MNIPSRRNAESNGDFNYSLFDDFYRDPYEEEEEDDTSALTEENQVHDLAEVQIKTEAARKEFRLILQKVDFLLPQLVDMVRETTFLDLTPRYQRRFRWQRKKQSMLIESLLLNIPMPSIFLYEYDPAKYEVMDGRQRLTTLYEFFRSDGFRLSGLKELAHLNGLTYDKLPPKLQASLRRASFPVTIILSENEKDANPRLRQLVFERLNTGGQNLSYQEVRNCIFDGHFNEMLVRVARSKTFTTVWKIPPSEKNEKTEPSKALRSNRYFATMQDCEIVLRYFAFADTTKYAQPKQKLDAFMKSNYLCSVEEAQEFERDYLQSLELAYAIYGENTFGILPQFESAKRVDRQLSAPFADAVLLACKKYAMYAENLIAQREYIVADTESLMKSKSTYDDLIGSKNTKEEFTRKVAHLSDIFEKYK